MSDAAASQTSHAVLDPDRPWIVNEEELPSRMNWLDTLVNPTGKSPKLHFTRAWTVLFFTGLFAWVGFGFIISILGIAGADTSGVSVFHGYFVAVVLAITSICSYVIHTRRLNHARKFSLWSTIVLLPLIAATLLFLGGMIGKAAEYDKLYQERAEFLEDPAAWREARLEEQRVQQAEAEKARQEAEAAKEDGEGAGENKRQRGGQGRGGQSGWNQGPTADNPLPSKESFIVRPNLGSFNSIIVGLNALIMIWSLLWVARTPNFGTFAATAGGIERTSTSVPKTPWMPWKQWFFSLHGRIRRLQFWLGTLVVVIASIPITITLAVLGFSFQDALENANQTGETGPLLMSFFIGLVANLPLQWVSFSIAVKRFHDLGRSGRWALYFFIAQIAFSIVLVLSHAITANPSSIHILIGLISIFLALAYIIYLGFFPSDPGDNEYGAGPRHGPASPDGRTTTGSRSESSLYA